MTREEAARVLEEKVEVWEGVLKHMLPAGDYSELKQIEDYETALRMGAVALRGPEPDPDTGLMRCDYCNGSGEQKPLFHENNYEPHTRMMSTISIEENNGKHQIEIDLWDGGNVYAAFEINYCPMCGRKLEEANENEDA